MMASQIEPVNTANYMVTENYEVVNLNTGEIQQIHYFTGVIPTRLVTKIEYDTPYPHERQINPDARQAIDI